MTMLLALISINTIMISFVAYEVLDYIRWQKQRHTDID